MGPLFFVENNVFEAKKTITNPINKIDKKNLTNTTNQVGVAKNMHVKNPHHSRKQNSTSKIAENQESTSRKTCKRQKVYKRGIGPKK